MLSQFDAILENFTCLYGILSLFLSSNFQSEISACAKKLTFRRSECNLHFFNFYFLQQIHLLIINISNNTFVRSPVNSSLSSNQKLHSWCNNYFQSFSPPESRFAHMCVCVCVYICVSVYRCVCSLLRYRLTVFWPPLPKVGCLSF